MSTQPPIAALSRRALIAVSGEDWRSFLHGLITQDVESLAPGEVRFGALLNPQGRLLFDLFVVGRDDGAFIDVPQPVAGEKVRRLAASFDDHFSQVTLFLGWTCQLVDT